MNIYDLSGFNCNCPNTDPLTTIPTATCLFYFDQVQRNGFVKFGNVEFDTATPANSIPVVAGDPTLEAGWTALRAASDDTKVVFDQRLGGSPIISAGEPITIGGGDNSTMNGEELIRAKLPSVFTAFYADITPEQETALQALGCNNIGWFPVTRDGKIWGQSLAADKFTPIPISAFFVGDRGSEGFGTRNTNQVRFNLAPGWSNSLAYIVPSDFDALTF